MLGFFVAFALVQDQPLPKIAEVDSAGGTVEIVSPKGTARRPVRFGTRWKNAEIRDEDRIKTAEGSQAVILFPDASKFTLKENSEIQILQKKLPKPTPEGNTVGRRIKVLVGDLVGDVIPNKDVRTDFEMPAGSAAVRGTRLRLTVAGSASTLAVSDGDVRFTNGKYSVRVDVGSGQAVRLTEGSVTIDVLEDAGRTLPGQIGDRFCGFTADDKLKVDLSGTNLSVDVQAGSIDVNGQATTNDFEAAPDATVGADTANFDPTADTAGVLPEGEALPGELIGLDTTGDPLSGPDLTNTATNVGTSGTGAISLMDTFDRPSGFTVGGGWIEFLELGNMPVNDLPGSYTLGIINNNAVGIFYAGGGSSLEGDILYNIGHLSTFDGQATYSYTGAADEVTFGVNFDPATDVGVFIDYFPASGLIEIEDATGTISESAPMIGPGVKFTLRGTFDGTTGCASLLDATGAILVQH